MLSRRPFLWAFARLRCLIAGRKKTQERVPTVVNIGIGYWDGL